MRTGEENPNFGETRRMRRRCIYSVYKRGRHEVRGEYSPKYHGWLIQIVVSGNVTFYFIETSDGRIARVHEAYCDMQLVAEDTPFPKPEEGGCNA